MGVINNIIFGIYLLKNNDNETKNLKYFLFYLNTWWMKYNSYNIIKSSIVYLIKKLKNVFIIVEIFIAFLILIIQFLFFK